MNAETIIALIVLIYAISVTIALACAMESSGFWEHKTLAAEEALGEARAEIDDDNVIIAWQRTQIGGHIRSQTLLVHENEHLKSADRNVVELSAGELIDELDGWLAGEQVAP